MQGVRSAQKIKFWYKETSWLRSAGNHVVVQIRNPCQLWKSQTSFNTFTKSDLTTQLCIDGLLRSLPRQQNQTQALTLWLRWTRIPSKGKVSIRTPDLLKLQEVVGKSSEDGWGHYFDLFMGSADIKTTQKKKKTTKRCDFCQNEPLNQTDLFSKGWCHQPTAKHHNHRYKEFIGEKRPQT